MNRKRILSILIVIMLCVIWGNSMLSRQVSGRISDTVMEGMNYVAGKLGLGADLFTVMKDQDGDGVEEPTSFMVRKAAHVTEFAVLGVLLWLWLDGKKQARPLLTVGLGVLTGAIDETIQIFSHRGSQVTDVLIDSCGVLLAVAVMAWLTARQKAKAS